MARRDNIKELNKITLLLIKYSFIYIILMKNTLYRDNR